MRKLLGGVIVAGILPLSAFADKDIATTVHDYPAVRGSIIANLLQDHENPFTLYPYESNYLLYTVTDHVNKKAIHSYDWGDDARRDEVKFQLSLAFPLWRGILGENSVLGASYTQRSWWQLSNSDHSSPFRERTMNPSYFWDLRRSMHSPDGLCTTWSLGTTISLTGAAIRHPAAGIVCIRA